LNEVEEQKLNPINTFFFFLILGKFVDYNQAGYYLSTVFIRTNVNNFIQKNLLKYTRHEAYASLKDLPRIIDSSNNKTAEKNLFLSLNEKAEIK